MDGVGHHHRTRDSHGPWRDRWHVSRPTRRHGPSVVRRSRDDRRSDDSSSGSEPRTLTGVAAGRRARDGRRGRPSYLVYGAAFRGGFIESPAAERYPLGRLILLRLQPIVIAS